MRDEVNKSMVKKLYSRQKSEKEFSERKYRNSGWNIFFFLSMFAL